MNNSENINKFLDAHALSASSISINSVLAAFKDEMDKGLAGAESCLAMIPTFVSVNENIPVNEPVIVIDAGGTNLRVATLIIDNNNRVQIEDFSKYQMPAIENELSANDFFATLADYVTPVAHKSNKIGFCFSYPAEIKPDRDGVLIRWTKEVKAPDVVGQKIGACLIKAMGDSGQGKNIVLLNDTIATLLAGQAISEGREYSSYVGFILGTGTNIAYVEKNSNITKLNNIDPIASQAINMESGNFNKLHRGDLDIALDARTENPNGQMLEKIVSGRYLSELGVIVLKTAAKEGLFSTSCATWLTGIGELSGKEIDDFLGDRGISPLVSDNASQDDKHIIKTLLTAVYERAAKTAAINISAAVLKSECGTNGNHPVCVNIDGSTYYKALGFKDRVESYLAEILGARGISYDLVHADDAPMIGAAMAGLTN